MAPLTPEHLGTNPMEAFAAWFAEAERHSGLRYPNALVLGTRDEAGWPEGRVVLLKGTDPRGFLFFTNYDSAKGRALEGEPRASMTFHWDSLGRQVRVVGTVDRVSEDESDAYFASRPRESQLGAWASSQSRPLPSRELLEENFRSIEERYARGEVPRPPYWGGFLLRPLRMEFWQEGAHRLHDRIQFRRDAPEAPWETDRLFP